VGLVIPGRRLGRFCYLGGVLLIALIFWVAFQILQLEGWLWLGGFAVGAFAFWTTVSLMINRARDAGANLIVLAAPLGLMGIALAFLLITSVFTSIGSHPSSVIFVGFIVAAGMPVLSLVWGASLVVLALLPSSTLVAESELGVG
jgi:hypothetical protein